MGRVCKESVKVRTPKSPPSADDSPFDLAALYVFPHCARAEAQHVCAFAQRQQAISNCRRRVNLWFLALVHGGLHSAGRAATAQKLTILSDLALF
jgi:hypothetical protein